MRLSRWRGLREQKLGHRADVLRRLMLRADMPLWQRRALRIRELRFDMAKVLHLLRNQVRHPTMLIERLFGRARDAYRFHQ